ncbi:maleylacetoacetate isomerase [Paraburkholderia xenovorans]|uniref:maleylacetoacetate isomerase n=1 Tax=Paraburkholderia xenovorans TaxID=36873 RepID=UPI0038B812A0
MKLHGFYRSSASYRTRIALNLKGLAYETVSHDLTTGEHQAPSYLAINPQGLLPALEIDGAVLTQSGAIVEYLEERYPNPALLPADALARARVRALFQVIAADTHHVTSMRVGAYLKKRLEHDEAQLRAWQHHWLTQSFGAFEQLLTKSPATGRFCHGDRPTLADLALVPQVFAARRLDLDIGRWPTLARIVEACQDEKGFQDAHPDRHNPAR